MKRTSFVMVAALAICAFAPFALSAPKSYKGEIMDSACAKAGSHQMMKEEEGAKQAKDCTIACVKHGAQYVLYDKASKTIYKLDDQKKPEQFAGQSVVVNGTLDAASNTIHVESIKAGS